MKPDRVSGSFRDPSGFLFFRDGVLFRQINDSYASSYDALLTSGLYDQLTEQKALVPHQEVEVRLAEDTGQAAWKVIQPQRVPFISYPYEWAFGQLKAAALLTLSIQKRALEKNLSLRDASAYNIQFVNGAPVFIDTLSFGPYVEGEPWAAYQQFCRHFLAPLALAAHVDIALMQLSRIHIDGIPLELAAKLLPWSTKLRFSLLTHLHLHASASKKHSGSARATGRSAMPARKISRLGMRALIDSLESAVHALHWQPVGTEWADYYDDTNYSKDAHEHKKGLVSRFLQDIGPGSVWDLGANTGLFSRIAAERGSSVLAFDTDAGAVERHWQEVVARKETRVLPLLQDLTNPSPALGWEHSERSSWSERAPADVVMALALIHHLAISNNVPLARIASLFARLGRHLIIELVPKTDSQVQRLLSTREDIFPDYNAEGFEAAFAQHFVTHAREPVKGTSRVLYRMERQ